VTPESPTPTGGWASEEQVDWYVERLSRLEQERTGELVLLDALADAPQRVLDLGCGDGHLAAAVLEARPSVNDVVAVDRSAPMLVRARGRFAGDSRVAVMNHDLGDSIERLGRFDVVVSGFAIHHLEHWRKRTLFEEIAASLSPGGVFLNLEVVASATPTLHQEFLELIGRTDDDPEDRLAPVEDQLVWMRSAGLTEVDCLWRWRGFALLVGQSATV